MPLLGELRESVEDAGGRMMMLQSEMENTLGSELASLDDETLHNYDKTTGVIHKDWVDLHAVVERAMSERNCRRPL